MISMDETKSHNWGESRKATGNHMDAFTATSRTNGEPTRNDPRSCKTVSSSTRAYFSEANVRRRLLVFADQVARGGIDRDDRAALRRYTDRDMAAAAQRDMEAGR